MQLVANLNGPDAFIYSTQILIFCNRHYFECSGLAEAFIIGTTIYGCNKK